MSHIYPIATSAKAALSETAKIARTRYEAEALADGQAIAALETEWLTPATDDLSKILEQVTASPAHGFVQNYEDAKGNTVLAVTYWKITKAKKAKPKPTPKPDPDSDHTDDLYFRSGRNKKPKKRKYIDPNQLDMFGNKEA
jgi:hypothetical protein